MGRRQSRTAAGEDRVYIIPCQQGSIITAGDTCLIATLCKHRWHTRQRPLLWITHIEIALGILEIIHIRCIILSATSSTSYQLCELTSKRYVRRLLYVQERYLVKHRSEPLRLLFPVDIQSPNGVAQRFFAHVNLRCKCLLVKMHYCTTNLQTLRQLVLPVESQHRFALHAIFGIRLERYTYVGTSIYDALIQDCNLTCRVIHRVIRTLGKHNSTSRYYHRTTRNIICAKRNDIGRRAFVLTYQHILILLGHQLSYGLCAIVQFAENILLCLRYGKATVNQLFAQISSKRLGRRKEHTTIANSIPLNKVEISVGVQFIVIIQAVATQHLQQCGALYALIRDVSKINASCIALVFDIQTELGLLYS